MCCVPAEEHCEKGIDRLRAVNAKPSPARRRYASRGDGDRRCPCGRAGPTCGSVSIANRTTGGRSTLAGTEIRSVKSASAANSRAANLPRGHGPWARGRSTATDDSPCNVTSTGCAFRRNDAQRRPFAGPPPRHAGRGLVLHLVPALPEPADDPVESLRRRTARSPHGLAARCPSAASAAMVNFANVPSPSSAPAGSGHVCRKNPGTGDAVHRCISRAVDRQSEDHVGVARRAEVAPAHQQRQCARAAPDPRREAALRQARGAPARPVRPSRASAPSRPSRTTRAARAPPSPPSSAGRLPRSVDFVHGPAVRACVRAALEGSKRARSVRRGSTRNHTGDVPPFSQ